MSLLLRKENSEQGSARAGAPGIRLWVAGMLALGGAAGWTLSHFATASAAPEAATELAAESPAESPVDEAPALLVSSTAAPGVVQSPVIRRGLAVRPVSVTAPPDPFRPVAGAATAMPLTSPARPQGTTAPPAQAGQPKRPSAQPPQAGAPRQAAPAAEPTVAPPADLTLAGVIQGDSPLAVVRHGDQTLFLKIGDMVADTWRLEEVRERSAILRAPGRTGKDQRVEIPLKGGNSQ